MNKKQIRAICSSWDLGEPISLTTKVDGGLLHLMWRIDTEQGSYAIKQLSKNIDLTVKVRKAYELSEKVAHQFADHGIALIAGIEKEGKFLVNVDDSTFIIYPWVDAKVIDKKEVSVFHAVKIATLLAKIHLLNLSVPEMPEAEYDTHANEKIMALIEESMSAGLPFANKLKQSQNILIELNNKYNQSIFILEKVSVISHSDLDQKNVLWDQNNNPILIDWESVKALNPTYEILNAALDWSGATMGIMNSEIFLSMISAYKKAGGKLNQEVIDVAFDGLFPGHCINWLIYNIQRSLNNNSREKEIGMEQVKQVLQTIEYLESKIDDLTNMVRMV